MKEITVQSIAEFLPQHPFFAGLDESVAALVGRDRQHVGIAVERVLHAVAVVRVDVDVGQRRVPARVAAVCA